MSEPIILLDEAPLISEKWRKESLKRLEKEAEQLIKENRIYLLTGRYPKENICQV